MWPWFNPLLQRGASLGEMAFRRLGVFTRERCPEGSFPSSTGPTALRETSETSRGSGFPIVLIQGVDDDPGSLLRALCRAKACAVATSSIREAGLQFDLGSQKLALSAMAGWPPSQSVKELAEELNLAGRTLRRRMTAAGLPTPQRLVRYGRLLEAHLLWTMGIRSRERIASILHISGGSALGHLTRDLTGLSTDEFFRTARLEDLVARILARRLGRFRLTGSLARLFGSIRTSVELTPLCPGGLLSSREIRLPASGGDSTATWDGQLPRKRNCGPSGARKKRVRPHLVPSGHCPARGL